MNLPWKPWHDVVELREDLKSGELSLAMFAADLYDVVMGDAKPVYQDPQEFFALTYPTFNLRELVKEVVQRLSGRSDRAVRQLELTYGGGKTHALITLYHLVKEPDSLPDVPAINEFREHIGERLPQSRVATLTFDKLDAERGMKVMDPDGNSARFFFPWSVMAYQLAGEEGLKALGMKGREERETPPAENVVREILELPVEDDLSPLILIDEVLMWARTKAGEDPVWRGRLQAFFQCLTQAATKVDRCAIVASLLATEPQMSDKLGKQITRELYSIFRREREEAIQPVVKEDVAEILRRRFFTPESIQDSSNFRGPVMSVLKGISALDGETQKNKKSAEQRFVNSYPFHPDLTEVLYTKWTQLEGFQRTRGILRTFALALREAEKWDQCPIIGPNVFLNAPEEEGLSEGAQELANIAATEEYEGRRQEWSAILEGELGKARQVQAEYSGLEYREIEQAVMATFLHSQPIGQKAHTQEIIRLVGSSRPDKIDLQKGLQGWVDTSWFLDEKTVGTGASEGLPKNWRLGSRPNLRQIHHETAGNLEDDLIESQLLDQISSTKSLTEGAAAAGAKVHMLPNRPGDIQDEGKFHYAILGPSAACTSGSPSDTAKKFINETTGPDKPRVYRNAIVLAVPSPEGLEASKKAIRDFLGWEGVRDKLKDQDIDTIRKQMLEKNRKESKRRIADTIRQAYSIVVTVSETNEIEAFRVTVDDSPLFKAIKDDSRSRIQDTAVSADALLPGGPYDLWREGESSRRFQDLVGAFAQLPHLPKMLHTEEILDTLIQGAVDGLFVLKMVRPDGSVRTFWMEEPDEAAREDPGLEVVLPDAAELASIPSRLLERGSLPELWDDNEITVGKVEKYFSGEKVVQIERAGYEEPLVIPGASRDVVFAAVRDAVSEGRLWLTCDHASICGEEVPEGLVTEKAVLQSPPPQIPTSDLGPDSLPGVWEDGEATAHDIAAALSEKTGKTLPWGVVRDSIKNAIRSRELELADDSGEWPCEYEGAKSVKLQVPKGATPPAPPPKPPGVKIAEAELSTAQLQDLADKVGELVKSAGGQEMNFKIQISLEDDEGDNEEVVSKINQLLKEISENLQLE